MDVTEATTLTKTRAETKGDATTRTLQKTRTAKSEDENRDTADDEKSEDEVSVFASVVCLALLIRQCAPVYFSSLAVFAPRTGKIGNMLKARGMTSARVPVAEIEIEVSMIWLGRSSLVEGASVRPGLSKHFVSKRCPLHVFSLVCAW